MTTTDVNPTFTPRPRTTVVENQAFDAFARRIVRAYARRVADGDVEALPALVNLTTELDTAIHHAVQGLRAYGYSWADIAQRLGITRQGAWQRFNTNPTPPANGEPT